MITIIGILVGVAVPSYLAFQQRAKGTAVAANIRAVAPALEAYFVGSKTSIGVSQSALAASYDAVLAPSSFPNLSATSYCVESTVGSETYSRSGPGGSVVLGTC